MKAGEPRYFTPWRHDDIPSFAPRFVVLQVLGLVFAFDGLTIAVGLSPELQAFAARKAALKRGARPGLDEQGEGK